jgi:hypothetical protein
MERPRQVIAVLNFTIFFHNEASSSVLSTAVIAYKHKITNVLAIYFV